MHQRLWTATLTLAFVSLASNASAGHHQWFISEIYSNADGTIQFVQLKGTADNEQFINGFNVTTFGTIPTSAPIGPNLPSSATNGKYLLIATAGYAALAAIQGAPAPDRTLPNNFLQLDADTVRYAGIAATDRTYAPGPGALPTNGIDSLDFENPSSSVNSPQNFAGAMGSINAAPPAGPSVPALTRWSIVGLIGALVAGAGFLLKKRAAPLV
jgi:hypothetical protein